MGCGRWIFKRKVLFKVFQNFNSNSESVYCVWQKLVYFLTFWHKALRLYFVWWTTAANFICALCVGVNAVRPWQRVVNPNAQNLKQTPKLAAVVHHNFDMNCRKKVFDLNYDKTFKGKRLFSFIGQGLLNIVMIRNTLVAYLSKTDTHTVNWLWQTEKTFYLRQKKLGKI